MIRSLSSKVMWVGRATTFCVGLAVVLAVIFGVATTALAAVPGDPFKLGKLNTVNRLTVLAGKAAGPLLKVDNNGVGPALVLESDAGRPPLRINAAAGKAINLNADKLDGKNASSFLPTNSKAKDAVHSDKADDAGTLDGVDSGKFMRHFSRGLDARSATDSSASKSVTAFCPAGKIALGGGASISRPVATVPSSVPTEFPVALQSVKQQGYDGWNAEAAEIAPYDGDWRLSVSVTCVPAPPGSMYLE